MEGMGGLVAQPALQGQIDTSCPARLVPALSVVCTLTVPTNNHAHPSAVHTCAAKTPPLQPPLPPPAASLPEAPPPVQPFKALHRLQARLAHLHPTAAAGWLAALCPPGRLLPS